LRGSGKITLSDGQITGLDPRAFDVVTRAVDAGLPIESARISNVVAQSLTTGGVTLKQADGTLAINNGQVRIEGMKAASENADVSLSGALDLTTGIMDSHLVLSGRDSVGGVRPDIYMALGGPLADPQRSVDVSALTGWLTLRAVDNQAKKVKALEEAEARRRAEEEAAAKLRAEQARAEQEARAHAEDEAKLRALTGVPSLIAPDPVESKPIRVRPKEAASSVPTVPGARKVEPAPGILPLLESAPALPPPVNIERLPGSGPPRSP
jgi:large subunit ribosomal protein L24